MDIQVGDRVTFDNGQIKIIMNVDDTERISSFEVYKLIKIERPKYEVIEEKKELLTEEEKEFLKLYIKFIEGLKNGQVISIRRQSCWIILRLKTELEYQTEIGSKFKNMEDCKKYTLSKLGLEEI